MNASTPGPTIRYARAGDREACIQRARELATEIEELLSSEAVEPDRNSYGVHLAQAMARSLSDQLSELMREPSSGTRVASRRD